MKYLFISFSIIFFLAACNSTKKVPTVKKEVDDKIFLSLKKGPCFGKCPVYTISIYRSGFAELHGKAHTPNLGKFKKNLSKEQLNDLFLSCQDADLISMQDFYESQIADLPLITINYITDDSTKVIKGKEDRPPKLLAIQKKLEEMAKSSDWELVEPADVDNAGISPPEEDMEELINTEIIIQPAEGIRLPQWIKKNKERYGIRLLDRISAEKNYWLITWDQSKGTPDEFLNALHRDPEIKLAQFNLKVESRR